MPTYETYIVAERRREKERDRQDDHVRLAQGLDSPAEVRARNGLFEALDPALARIVGRRPRVQLEK